MYKTFGAMDTKKSAGNSLIFYVGKTQLATSRKSYTTIARKGLQKGTKARKALPVSSF